MGPKPSWFKFHLENTHYLVIFCTRFIISTQKYPITALMRSNEKCNQWVLVHNFSTSRDAIWMSFVGRENHWNWDNHIESCNLKLAIAAHNLHALLFFYSSGKFGRGR